ncbi:hypothetical protein BDW75DRAFT_240262 [Aspergillus navahoensis]
MASTDNQTPRNDATSLLAAPSETIIDLDLLLRSPLPLRQYEPILSLESLVAYPEAAVFASHTALSNQFSTSYLPTPLSRPLPRNPFHLSRLSRPPSYASQPPTDFAIEYTLQTLSQLPHGFESQIQPQPVKGDSDAPPSYPLHLTTNPSAPAYTSADKRRGWKIRFFEVLRGRRRSEKCWRVFISLLITLAVGALIFAVEEGLRRRPRPQLRPAH